MVGIYSLLSRSVHLVGPVHSSEGRCDASAVLSGQGGEVGDAKKTVNSQ
jgi:hypothetical protein